MNSLAAGHIASLILAIGLTPWLLSRLFLERYSWNAILAGWGPAMISINVAIPIALHVSAIPITANSLAIAHGLLAGAVGILFTACNRKREEFEQKSQSTQRRVFFPAFGGNPISPSRSSRLLFKFSSLPHPLTTAAILFALLVLPLTHIAGIDTYKWQDLAGNIAVEQRISWLIHPLSLLGFTPRSYSSAQPLVLATIQMLGHTGVDWGFYLLSLAFGLTGFSGAWALGRYLFKTDASAGWLAILYLFSPVFMRYNYWATGRGLLLALLPVYLLILLKWGQSLAQHGQYQENKFEQKSQSTQRKRIWLIPAWLLMTALLMMAHKGGVVGALLIPLLLLASPALALFRGRWGLWLAALLALAAGLLLVNGQPVTMGIRLITRFGWLLPLAFLAIATLPAKLTTPPFRALTVAGLGTLVISCTPDMYGALLALPFMACLATLGLDKITEKKILLNRSSQRPQSENGASAEGVKEYSSLRPSRASVQTLLDSGYAGLAIILIPALVIVLNQMRDSPSEAVYQAAQFIEQTDPRGPFRIEAPGKARAQIQAYVSGCPRFTVHAESTSQIEFHRPPPWTGKPAHDARQWIDFLRGMLELRGAHTDWYGDGAKVYYVIIDGQGTAPAQAKRLFTAGNVAVFE
ncbi:MAG: hypothetical protein WCS52_03845 [bacterium]